MKELKGRWGWLVLLLLAVSTAGCATVDQHVSQAYVASSGVVGGTGILYISASGKPGRARDSAVEWVVGPVKDDSGARTGEILSRVPPEELLLQALRAELTAAGYQVMTVAALTPEMAKGVDVTRIVMNLEVVRTAFKATGKSELEYDIDLMKNGTRFKKLRYNFALSDTAVSDKDRIADKVLNQSLQQLMKQSVPEIVRSLQEAARVREEKMAERRQ